MLKPHVKTPCFVKTPCPLPEFNSEEPTPTLPGLREAAAQDRLPALGSAGSPDAFAPRSTCAGEEWNAAAADDDDDDYYYYCCYYYY